MPIWHVLHPANVFTLSSEKAALVKDITALYMSSGLPAFYVNVFFHRFGEGDMWHAAHTVGESITMKENEASNGNTETQSNGLNGLNANVEPIQTWQKPFVHFEIDQIAVNITNEEWAKSWCVKVDNMLKPHIADKGYDWEYHIDETPRSLWRINGLVAPPWKSETERRWFEENHPSPW